jgi:predicted  nucleic acid-binding Zn-ribbon protein
MSPIGKIFAVLNIAMAAVFLGFASHNLAAHTSFKEQLETAEKKAEDDIAALNARLTTANEENQTLESNNGELRSSNGALKAELGVTQTNLAAERDDNATYKTNLEGISSTLEQYQATNESMQARAESAESGRTDAIEGRHTAENERDDAKEAEGQAREELAVAKNDIAQLERDREGLRKEKSALEAQLATVVEIYAVDLTKVKAMPALNGQILQVIDSIEPGLVSINLGTDDGVQRGFTFDVWAGNTYKGQVRVESVRANMCTALITRPVDGTKIAGGDKAATRL